MKEDLTDILAEEAKRRQRIFKGIDRYLREILNSIRSIDPKAEVYLFGSVAREDSNFSSDIDVLVLTGLKPAQVLSVLSKYGPPFEFHIYGHDVSEHFKKAGKLVRIT
ncbi:MAG: nucleotidyltransferase domain-containing protein [Nitrososphaerota archaeon]|jgi:predicted nucleotidyltransferase|nr:nucleotidyltransferase domain-containing protein [Nitrososphaerota archaeon]